MYLDNIFNKQPSETVSFADVQFYSLSCAETIFGADAKLIKAEAECCIFASESDKEGLLSKVKEIAKNIWDAIKSFFSKVKNFFLGVWNKIKSFFTKSEKEAKAAVDDAAKKASNFSKEQTEKAAETVKKKEEEAFDNLEESIKNAKSAPLSPEVVDEVSVAIEKNVDDVTKLFAIVANETSEEAAKAVEEKIEEKTEEIKVILAKKTEEAKASAIKHINDNVRITCDSNPPVNECLQRLQSINSKTSEIDKKLSNTIDLLNKSIQQCEAIMAKAKDGSIAFNSMKKVAANLRSHLAKITEFVNSANTLSVRSTEYVKKVANYTASAINAVEKSKKDIEKMGKKVS